MDEREQGIVRWFREDKSFGYIMREDDSDVYVHQSSIKSYPPTLVEGQEVEFTVVNGPKGPEAFDVTVVQ